MGVFFFIDRAMLMFDLADQIDQVAVVNIDVYDGETIAKFFIRVLLDGELDGIHFNLLFRAMGFSLCKGIRYTGFSLMRFVCTNGRGKWIYVILALDVFIILPNI
jgi:hypothetical protein